MALQTPAVGAKLFILGSMLLAMVVLPISAGAISLISLAGDKDSFGTGLPLTSQIDASITSHDPWDGDPVLDSSPTFILEEAR